MQGLSGEKRCPNKKEPSGAYAVNGRLCNQRSAVVSTQRLDLTRNEPKSERPANHVKVWFRRAVFARIDFVGGPRLLFYMFPDELIYLDAYGGQKREQRDHAHIGREEGSDLEKAGKEGDEEHGGKQKYSRAECQEAIWIAY